MKWLLIAMGMLLLIIAAACTKEDHLSTANKTTQPAATTPVTPIPEDPATTGDLGAVKEILKNHLLPGGKLARGHLEAPPLAEADYSVAFGIGTRDATPNLKALLKDADYRNVVLNFDHFMRNYLNEDGTPLYAARIPRRET